MDMFSTHCTSTISTGKESFLVEFEHFGQQQRLKAFAFVSKERMALRRPPTRIEMTADDISEYKGVS
jgi:hypothetical protein